MAYNTGDNLFSDIHMKKAASSKIEAKIRKLIQIAKELRQGESFSITRLTIIKNLCKDSEAAAHFALHLAKLTQKKMEGRSCPNHKDAERWLQYKNIVAKAILPMESYLEKRTDERASLLKGLLSEVEKAQNKYEYQEWGLVRIIESKEVLLVERALYCVLSPSESAFWGYRIARGYAERYDPKYGTGLIPDSAPW